MLQIHRFTFNPYQENTYLIIDDISKETIIVDPGMYTDDEKQALYEFVKEHELKITEVVNTHCHIDHVLGNKFACETFGVSLRIPRNERSNLDAVTAYGPSMGIMPEKSPEPSELLDDSKTVKIGEEILEIIEAPGHTAGHICFYHQASKNLLCGDVLFRGSIGRTDLPGGSFETIMYSIFNKLLVLPEDTVVHSGHGESTTIGHEKQFNPFLQAN